MNSLLSALDSAIIALGDWVATYAPEFSDDLRITEARHRINEYGTLAYVSHVLNKCITAKEVFMKSKFKVGDEVELHSTNSILDTNKASVMGFYGNMPDGGPLGVIVMFITPISGYDRAMVITPSCIKLTEE